LYRQTGQVMTLLLGSIASVSLMVGGIGIMKIMRWSSRLPWGCSSAFIPPAKQRPYVSVT
jgi:hypothetical protein